MKRTGVLLVAIVLLFAPIAMAADPELNGVVSALESSYGIKRTHLPWVARFAAKPAMWGSGAKMEFEVFEDQGLPLTRTTDLGEVTGKALGPEWRLFVRTESRRDGERALIYIRPEGKHLLMMIIAAERGETSVLKLKLDPSRAQEWIDDPVEMGKEKQKH
jgi:hypothetical protein